MSCTRSAVRCPLGQDPTEESVQLPCAQLRKAGACPTGYSSGHAQRRQYKKKKLRFKKPPAQEKNTTSKHNWFVASPWRPATRRSRKGKQKRRAVQRLQAAPLRRQHAPLKSQRGAGVHKEQERKRERERIGTTREGGIIRSTARR